MFFSMPVFILLTRIDWLTDRQNPLLLKDHWYAKMQCIMPLWKKIGKGKKILQPARLEGGKHSCHQSLMHAFSSKLLSMVLIFMSNNHKLQKILSRSNSLLGHSALPWFLLQMLGSGNQFNCKRYIPENELLLTWQVLCWSRSHRMCLFYPLVCTPIKGAINVTQIVWQRLHTSLTGKLSQ